MVESEESRKARKEHESAANVASTIATGEAGLLRTKLANDPPVLAQIKTIEEILEQMKADVTVDTIDELVAETVEVVEEIIDEVTEEVPDAVVEEPEAALPEAEEEAEV